MIGNTGHGKSATCNSLSNTKEFKSKSGLNSETYKIKAVITKSVIEEENTSLMVIDTPGMEDSENRDLEHLTKMIAFLNALGYIHTFVIAIRDGCRLDRPLQDMIKLFINLFQRTFFFNVVICITHFGYD